LLFTDLFFKKERESKFTNRHVLFFLNENPVGCLACVSLTGEWI